MSPLPFVGLNGSRERGPVWPADTSGPPALGGLRGSGGGGRVWGAYPSVPPALGVAAQAARVFTVPGTPDEVDPDAAAEGLDPLDEHAETASAATATAATADHFVLLLTLS